MTSLELLKLNYLLRATTLKELNAIQAVKNIPKFKILSHDLVSAREHLLIDLEGKKILLCEGTDWRQPEDIEINMDTGLTKSKLHRGYARRAQSIKDSIDHTPDIISGFSLGGATAQCLATLYKKPIEVYSFGSPAVSSVKNQNYKFVHNYYLKVDPVRFYPSPKWHNLGKTFFIDAKTGKLQKETCVYRFTRILQGILRIAITQKWNQVINEKSHSLESYEKALSK